MDVSIVRRAPSRRFISTGRGINATAPQRAASGVLLSVRGDVGMIIRGVSGIARVARGVSAITISNPVGEGFEARNSSWEE